MILHRRRGNGQKLKELHSRKTEKLSTSTLVGSTWINVVETKASRNGHTQWDSVFIEDCVIYCYITNNFNTPQNIIYLKLFFYHSCVYKSGRVWPFQAGLLRGTSTSCISHPPQTTWLARACFSHGNGRRAREEVGKCESPRTLP